MQRRIDYYKTNPDLFAALAGTHELTGTIEPRLKALIDLRVSQMNGCAYCIDLHSTQARAVGEDQQRLDCLPTWRECLFFDARERAALAWAEAITNIATTGAPDALFASLQAEFSAEQIVDLTAIIALMNAWNRIAISFRQAPGRRRARAA